MLFHITFPFLMGFFISYLIFPAVEAFERKGLSRSISIIFVFILFISTSVVAFMLIFPHVTKNMRELAYSLPNIFSIYKEKVDAILDLIVKSGFPADTKQSILREFTLSVGSFEKRAISEFKDFLIDSISFLPTIFGLLLSFIISYYFIRDLNVIKKFAYTLIPSKYRNDANIVGIEINSIMRNFVQGQFITALIVGALETLGLWMVGVKFPFFLGLIGGLANIIPFFGPFIGSIPAVIIALSQSNSAALWSILVFVIVQQIDNALISPRIIEGKLGLHPIFTILIVLLAGELFGAIGMLIGVPVVAILKVILKRVIERNV